MISYKIIFPYANVKGKNVLEHRHYYQVSKTSSNDAIYVFYVTVFSDTLILKKTLSKVKYWRKFITESKQSSWKS